MGSDIILGMDVDSMTPIMLYTRPHSISFCKDQRLITIMGNDTKGILAEGDVRSIAKLLRMGHGCLSAHLLSLDGGHEQQLSSGPVQKLIEQFAEIFQDPKELHPNRGCDHAIEWLPSSKPVNQRPYSYSYEQKNTIERMVREMLETQIVITSTSPFASPVILVKKKDPTWRFCVDYRRLNDITVKNKYPIPVVEDLLDKLHGAQFFSKIDLRSEYHQIHMKQRDEYKKAFKTHHGLWKFRLMPFELTNASATFQALMHKVFNTYLRKFVLVFFDDILIYNVTLEDHVKHLRVVFDVLKENQLFAKQSKCSFGED